MSTGAVTETTIIIPTTNNEQTQKRECFQKIYIAVGIVAIVGGIWGIICSTDCSSSQGSSCSMCPQDSPGIAIVFIIIGILGILMLACKNQIYKGCSD